MFLDIPDLVQTLPRRIERQSPTEKDAAFGGIRKDAEPGLARITGS